MLTYPATVSRTLDPTGRSLYSVVGQHDKDLSDADFNLTQDLENYKRQQLLKNQASSGPLQYAPFSFNLNRPGVFTIPAFDALVFGQTIRVGGNRSANQALNNVVLPAPSFWSAGQPGAAAQIYVAFLEFWYQRLDSTPGSVQGYYQDSNGNLYYYPLGCRVPDVTNQTSLPNDTIDPFSQLETTERIQVQWAIRMQPVGLNYDFTKNRFGLDQDLINGTMVYATGNQAANVQLGSSAPEGVPAIAPSPWPFVNMAAINGDAGVWRAGQVGSSSLLGTMDWYVYAMPLAVIFQRNTGIFNVSQNPFGCAKGGSANSGLMSSGVSGRYDLKFADVVYADDVVDTRSSSSLTGWDEKALVEQGFVDLISGTTQQALGRGQTPGNLPAALGSQVEYFLSVAPEQVTGTDTVGAFDGFRNGFSASDHSFTTVKSFTVEDKTVGAIGSSWQFGDAFSVSLPSTSAGVISAIQLQALVTNFVTGAVTPALLLPGQVTITGLGTKVVSVAIAKHLAGTPFDPGASPIFATLTVDYAANGGMDLRQIPSRISGGSLYDFTSGQTLPVFSVSEYDALAQWPALYASGQGVLSQNAPQLITAYNSEYSSTIFGTRVNVAVHGTDGVVATLSSGTVTTVSLNYQDLQTALNGIYIVAAWDQASGAPYTILGRSVATVANGAICSVEVSGAVPTDSTVIVSVLCSNTAQLVYNAPTRGVTSIEETVLFGNAPAADFTMDSRIAPLYVAGNIALFAASDAILRGVSGDDVNKLIWIKDVSGAYKAVQLGAVNFIGGLVMITAPTTLNLAAQTFFMVGSIYPSFDPSSTLTLAENYIPYQGEGRAAVDYEILHTENFVLATTNGTGAAPVPGLADVYPYNRELPIITRLPSQVGWSDADLTNTAVSSLFDSNYVAKRQSNVEHTFEVPAHTNDFVDPITGGKRKAIQLLTASGGRGFAKATPHIGFAIEPLSNKLTGVAMRSTVAPVVVYVNNITGSDANDGTTPSSALLTIQAALALLPGVLLHPCSIQLAPTGKPYSIAAMQRAGIMAAAALGDGDVNAAKYYAIGVLAYTIQGSGRLVITAQTGATSNVTIDCTGYTPQGDGPTSAFFVDNSRVIFNGLTFNNFEDAAVKGIASRLDFVGCQFTNNINAGSFEQGCSVILDNSSIALASGCLGMVLSQSALDSSNTLLVVSSGTPSAFFVAERGSSLTLDQHSASQETGTSSSTLIAWAQLNSSIVCTENFSSSLGSVLLQSNSVLSRSLTTSPFLGGIVSDASSSVTTSN